MAKSKDIALVDGFDWHGTFYKTLTLKEPGGKSIAELGEPRILVRTSNGMYFVEQTNTIRQYIERCLTHEGGSMIVGLLTMTDYLLLKDEIADFFTQAELRITEARRMLSSSD